MTWTPGHRRRPPGLFNIRESYLMVASLGNMTIRLVDEKGVIAPPAGILPEEGPDIALTFKSANGKTFRINLATLNADELAVLKAAFAYALDQAEPVVLARDEHAAKEAENGNDLFDRRYRGSPKITFPRGPVAKYGEGVHDGHQDAVAGDEPADADKP